MNEALKELEIPNDPNHPLRLFVFRWVYRSHIDHSTWYGETHRDEVHGLTRILRDARPGKTSHNRPMGIRYRFDGEEEELEYHDMVARLREQHGEFVGNIQNHPLVLQWLKDREPIPFEPSPPGHAIGATVKYNFTEHDDELRARLLNSRAGDMRGTVQAGNALYVLVAFPNGESWVECRRLDTVTDEVDHAE